MGNTKFTEKGQDQRSKHLAALRDRLAKVRRLESIKDSEEWKNFAKLLDTFAEQEKQTQRGLSIRCARFEDSSDSLVGKIAASVQREMTFEMIRDLVDRAPDQESQLKRKIEDLETQYAEAAASLR